MTNFIILSVVCLQLGWTYGDPAKVKGVGAFAYQDSAGNSVTGRRAFTSRAELERFVPIPPIKPLVPIKPFKPFKPLPRVRPRRPLKPLNLPHDRVKRFLPALPPLPPLKSHFPRLKPLFPRLKPLFPRLPPLRPFKSHFKSRFHNYDFNRFNQFMMPLGSPNSAFAGAAAGPGFTHQVAALSPENPSEPNINIMNRFSDSPGSGSNFYSVSSSSYSSSANVDGQEKTHKRAETLVNNNGVVTHYKVEN